jgi:DNA-binding transcriptional regulator YbjK
MAADGVARYARGTQRRAALVQAAAGLLLEHGLAALSHRAVAARAGLPLASTTYYFRSADDLRDAALHHVAEGWARRAGVVVDALPPRLDSAGAAQAVVQIIGADAPSQQLQLLYERYLEAGRHERLRPVVVAWNGRVKELVGEVLHRAGLLAGEDRASLVLAVADGVAVTALAEGTPPDAAVRAAIGRLLALFEPPSTT